MDLELNDKIAIVTGSSRGLGLASARALVARGLPGVHLRARGRSGSPDARDRGGGRRGKPSMVARGSGRRVHGRRRRSWSIDRTVETFGGLDILVNNVGRAAGTDLLGTTRRRVAGGVRRNAVSRDPRLARWRCRT